VRDLEDIRSSALPVFAKAVTPLGPYREGPGEINVPVCCGGQVVMPGDILVGDADGVVVVPRRDAREILTAARANLAGEQREIELMREGHYTESAHKETFTGRFLAQGGSIEE
jgi:regulator of RNase E activity RraA